MPHALSNDLRERVVEYVEDGKSRREAARRLKVASSTAVRVVKTFRETGSFAPKPRGGYRHGKLPPHRDFILAKVAAQPDITMPELAAVLLQEKTVTVAPATVSRFLIGCGLSFKKNTAGKRTRQA
jgi:transposase